MKDSVEQAASSEKRAKAPEQWRQDEWECVKRRREQAFPSANADHPGTPGEEPRNLTGLALSGGGIRSALFNDGFLQALSHRGLLRYVDFLCSVSGGGYIAGHLTSQSDSESEQCFHDDPKRRDLGRDPETGETRRHRLPGIGGYLSRPLEFIPAYLWSLFFSLAFYFGAIGIVATLAALLWRSFDSFAFRGIYDKALGLNQYGDELTIAFLPAFILIAFMVAGEIGLTFCRFSSQVLNERLLSFHRRFRATMLLGIVFASLTSIAIFLGNGKSFVRDGSDTLYLNRYVQYFAILAGTIQVLVFLGRDRLFRSERGEAKSWQRYAQQSVTTMVVVTLVFSMVHWMGRENISGYTEHRDPHLVVGDVLDWPRFTEISNTYQSADPGDATPEGEDSPATGGGKGVDSADEKIQPPGSWHGAVVRSRINLFGMDRVADGIVDPNIESSLSEPPPPDVITYRDAIKSADDEDHAGPWLLPTRILAAAHGYWRSIMRPIKQDNVEDAGKPESSSIQATVNRLIADNHKIRVSRAESLKGFNTNLESVAFTYFLLAQLVSRDNDSRENNRDWQSAITSEKKDEFLRVNELVDSGLLRVNKPQAEQLATYFHSLQLRHPDVESANDGALNNARDATFANRMLLEGLYPKVVQRYDIPSTLVVPPHDQQTRKRWLLGWTLLMLTGLLGGLGPRRVATVFHFYRRQLASNFLVPTESPGKRYGDRRLSELDPCRDGLPYPLILAGALKPSLVNGSYRVAARPFVFSPKYCGSFEERETPIDSHQVSFSGSPHGPPLTLADAVTLSGAAVTPLMTQNRWLTIILDFFNTGIGQRVRRTDRTAATSSPANNHPWILSLSAAALVGGVCWEFVGLRWSLLLVMPTTALFWYCWCFQIGSPGWIRSLCFPKDSYHEPEFNQNQSFYVADGGYVDYLGVSELLRRRCETIVVSDAGANVGGNSLGTLATMCERAAQEQGIRFLDLDHEAPIDFGRLEINQESRLVHQPFLCMRVRYPEPERPEALLVYCQMSITSSDPIEIQNIRNLFPSFPDEPTVNQFYNEKQVAAYRSLGYHIGSRFCSELYPWFNNHPESWMFKSPPKNRSRKGKAPVEDKGSTGKFTAGDEAASQKHELFQATLRDGVAEHDSIKRLPMCQPLSSILRERLLTSYRLACYHEVTYHKDDIFAEAIWTDGAFACPTLAQEIKGFLELPSTSRELANKWLKRYECNADLRSVYRKAVIEDTNSLGVLFESYCGALWSRMIADAKVPRGNPDAQVARVAAHLTCIAAACQEVHQGRPSAVFQVGGRSKLIDLCWQIAQGIVETAPKQAGYFDINQLFRDMDSTIAELIEMERSVFQGGEHVATISFAQCMSTAWGKLAHDAPEGPVNVEELAITERLFLPDGVLGTFEQRGITERQSIDSMSLMTAEIRHQLDVGMREIRLKEIRHALAKSWFLGFCPVQQQRLLKELETIPDESEKERETEILAKKIVTAILASLD
ncbi:patatin-like phospholipase domain-containing protein [Allorhodopirellula solitaria]|uniref:Patatin-like phospholipase n=1 Tax=Allorhodopirellula solitaria TaxID=2527987 RepID=A0A5C5XX44_9BACT|nr:hypothetical protein [Allorhodopirellula solitaria]TWT66182.1 hypothetical protein CA85_30460 [Allorhodopirellula solitaria]